MAASAAAKAAVALLAAALPAALADSSTGSGGLTISALTVCELPIVPGPCLGSFPRWGYDEESGQCVEFIYGGCGGNGNRYDTQAECEKACDVPPIDVCELPIDPGPRQGAASFPRWGFNGEECVEFLYNCCMGNGNRFETQAECEKTCDVPPVDVCELDIVPGPCRGIIPRWGFNGKECVKFTYGGCLGNGNNFETQGECEEACGGGGVDICTLPIYPPDQVVFCRAAIPRWTYDAKKGCVQFTYGGCGGTENIFESEKECLAACGK